VSAKASVLGSRAMRLLCAVLVVSVAACSPNPGGGTGGGGTGTAGSGTAGSSATGGGNGGTGGGTGTAGGAPFTCAECAATGTVCVDGVSCAAMCPNSRAQCAGSCCEAGSRCCAIGMACADAGAACPALCPDGVTTCPDDQFCQGTSCVATCDSANRCGTNGCCGPGATCVNDVCALPDLVPLAPLDSGTLLVERRNFDPLWCDVTRGCVKNAGERALLHFKFRVANQGAAPVDLTKTPGSGLLQAACTGEPPKTWRHFARWELFGQGDAGVVTEGSADLHCLRDDQYPDGGAIPDAGKTFTCTMQGLSSGIASEQPQPGICTTADVSNLDAGTYRLSLNLNPTGALPEERLDNNRISFPVELPDTSCRGRICGGVTCCPPNTQCNASGGCALPDLIVDEPLLAGTVQFINRNFPANDCAIQEGCIGAGGQRRLLRFSTSTPNVGEADFFIGDPQMSANASYAACHGHYHYHQYANYKLLTADGGEVVRGNKQAFCALDSDRWWPDAGPAKYNCSNQGVSVGWADTYDRTLDCQWIDITGVAAGNYVLEVEVNPNRYIAERSYTNNVARVPVGIPVNNNGSCVPSTEICGNGIDEDCDTMADDGCAPLTMNDTCATAHNLGEGGEFTAQILPTSTADVSPTCGGAGGDLFFRFQLLVPELVYLSTYGSSIDTVMALYSGATCGTESACVDDGCALTQGHLVRTLPAGDYVVAVKAKTAGANGIVKMNLQRSPCTSAQPISAPGVYSGNNTAATNQYSLSCGGVGGVDDLWYFASCPSSTSLSVQTCGATWDTVVGVKQGSCRSNESDCDDDGCGTAGRGSRLTTQLTKPGLWFIVVDGYDANDRGAYSLSVAY